MAYPRHHQVEPGGGRTPHLREVDAQARGVADELVRARLALGYDLEQVAEILRIRYDHLRAIEEGRFNDLPGPTYVIGFLRSYARFLGLDAEDLVARFKAETADFAAQQKLDFPSPIDEGRLPTGRMLLVALALAGAAYGGWYYVNNVDRLRNPQVPEVPAEIVEQAGLAKPETAPPAPAAPAAGASEAEAPSASAPTPAPAAEAEAPAAPTAESAPSPAPALETRPAATVAAAPSAPVQEQAAAPPAPSSEPAPAPVAEAAPETPPPATDEAAPTTATGPALAPAPSAPETDGGTGIESRRVEPHARGRAETAPVPAPRAAAAALPAVPPPAEAMSGYVPRVFGRANVDARIRLRASQEAWVQITGTDNELVLTRILRPGDVYLVPNKPGLTLMTGNAGGIEITVDGKSVGPLGPVGAVRRDVALDPDKLLAGRP